MKTKFIVSIITVVFILTCLFGLTALAASESDPNWIYGSKYTDNVSTFNSQNLGKHPHSQLSIGATNIQVTTPSSTSQKYHLELYTRTWGTYNKFGGNVACQTSGVGGYYYWSNSNPDKISNKYAYVKIVKDSSGTAQLGGKLTTTSRTWK